MIKHKAKQTPRVLGIGNALVDIMIALPDDSLLHDFGLPRGSMTLVDSDQSAVIYQRTRQYQKDLTTGGSAANAIHALASLGGNCGYAGKIGDDDLGRLFAGEFNRQSVETHLPVSHLDTGRVMAMVSPDSERTMATFLGAAIGMTPGDFSLQMLGKYDIVFVEGYLVQDHQLIRSILEMSKAAGLKVAIDLSSYNVVEQNLELLRQLVIDYVDIVFANEEEALAFTGKHPDEALIEISSLCEVAVVKTGKLGSLVKSGRDIFRVAPVPAHAIDTTGAGDCYAAGFLYGLSSGLSLDRCGAIGSLVASKAVEHMGAKIPAMEWPALLDKVKVIAGVK